MVEQPEPSPVELELYAKVMSDIRQRNQYAADTLRRLIASPPEEDLLILEGAALQVRKSLEMLALSTLVTNKSKFVEVGRKFNGGKAQNALLEVKRLNPQFWPVAACGVGISLDSEVPNEISVPDNPLKEEDWDKAYAFVSGIIHAKNPYKDRQREPKWIESSAKQLLAWMDQLRDLLMFHGVILQGDKRMVMARLQGQPSDPVHVWLAAPDEEQEVNAQT